MFSEVWNTIAKRREFRRNTNMSRAQFEAMKLDKFRKLLRYIAPRSAYYAKIISERGIDVDSCTPADFPVLTKSILMANFDQIVTDPRITRDKLAGFLTTSVDPNELYLDHYHVIHTSGSSGEVGYFVYSPTDWIRGMSQGGRSRSIPGLKRKRRGKFHIAFYGAIGGHFAGVSMISWARRAPSRWFVDIGLYEINTPLPQVIEALNAFQPEVLAGYTTGLKILAAKQREGVLRISPLAIGTAGEGMTAADKSVLEEAFGCEASSGYGCSEHLMMGASVPGRPTMILYDDDLIYEFKEDHSLVTNLFNFTLPLIRYRMSDILRPIANGTLASPYIEIDSLVGRTERVPAFINRDGVEDFISPHTINEIFVAGVTRFQLHLVSNSRFRFLVCLDVGLNQAQRAAAVAAVEHRLREILDQKLMSNVNFEVVVVDDLPVNPRTRKFQLIVEAPEASPSPS